jgi:hypothetical protein
MHGVADTGGDLFIVLLDPIESLVQGVALILVAGTRGVPGAIALAGFAVAIGALVFAVPHAGGQPATD